MTDESCCFILYQHSHFIVATKLMHRENVNLLWYRMCCSFSMEYQLIAIFFLNRYVPPIDEDDL